MFRCSFKCFGVPFLYFIDGSYSAQNRRISPKRAAILRFKMDEGSLELRSHRLVFFALRLTIETTTARNI